MIACTGSAERWKRRATLVLATLPAWLVLIPVAVVLFRAVAAAEPGWSGILEHRLSGHLLHTALLVAGTVALAIALGLPAAWVISTRQFMGRKTLEWLLLLPLTMPGFIAATAYVDALQQMTPFYIKVREHFGVDAFLRVQALAPWCFAITVLGATLCPYVYLSCRSAFARQATSLLASARLLGAGPWRTFFTIALPLARPAIAAGAVLVAMETVNDVGVVGYFGLSPLTPGIFRAWGEGQIVSAMRLAVVLMAFVIVLLALERWQRGRARQTLEGGDGPPSRRRSGTAATLAAWCICGLPLALGFIIPAARLLRWALLSVDKELDWQAYGRALWHSASVAAMTACWVVLGALFVLGAQRLFHCGFTQWARRFASLGYAFPSALIAVGLGAFVSTIAAWPGLSSLALSASVFGLGMACFIRFLAVGIQPIHAGFQQVSADLIEAARTLGTPPFTALRMVELPLIRPAIIAAATLVFIDAFKELTLTLVLRPFDYETLATLVYRLTDEGRIPDAALPALMLVACSLIGMIPLHYLLRKVSP
jgi:iron(III) transport system permease protein